MYTFEKEYTSRNIEVIKIQDINTKKSVYLNSKVSPRKEIEKFGNGFENNKCYFIIGSGNGSILQLLDEINIKSKFYIIEIFPEIQYDEEYISKLMDKNIYLYYATDLNYIVISGAIRDSFGMEFEILLHPNYDKLNVELLSPIIEKVKRATITAKINKNTEKYFQYEWLTEPILNLSLSKNGKSLLNIKEKIAGKPLIIVASGPSLNDNLDFIRTNKDKAYIIATGSAVNGLINKNITPDFVTILDAGLINYTAHFQNTKYIGPIISPGTTNHKILKNHKGEIFFTNFAQDTITKEVRPELLMIPMVPSVALYTLILAHYLEVCEVYLVGQDLALREGEYYADGVQKHDLMKNLGPTLEVEGNLGGKVVTTYSLGTMLESLNNIVDTIQNTGSKMEIYNLSKIGAKITGVSYKDADNIYLKENIDKSWIHRLPIKNELDYYHSLEYINKIKDCKVEVDYVVKKIEQMKSNAVSLKDLEKLLKLIRKLRENEILETHILNMIYTTTKVINNMFEFGFEDNFHTNEARIEMLQKLKLFAKYIQEYLDGLINHTAWSQIDLTNNEHNLIENR